MKKMINLTSTNVLLFGYFAIIFSELADINYLIAKSLELVCILIFCYKIFIVDDYKNKHLLFVLLLITFLLGLFSVNKTLFLLVLMFLAGKNLSFDKILKVSFISHFTSFLLGIILFVVGLRPDRVRLKLEIMYQHTLGFSHYNTLGYFVMMIAMMIVICYRDKLKIKHYLALILTVVGFFIVHGSASSSMCAILFIFGVMVLNKIENYVNNFKYSKTLVYLAVAIFVLLMTIIPLVSFNLNGNLGLLSNFFARFSLANEAIKEYGIGFLGKNFWYERPIDNLYAYDLFYTGIIATLIFYVINGLSLMKICKEKRWDVAILFIVLVIYSSMEMCMFGVRNPFVALPLSICNAKRER